MWIRSQNKQRIINSDQIIDIFVGKTGTKIIANTTCYDLDASEIILGEYNDRDTCLKVLDVLMVVMGDDKFTFVQLPLGGNVELWVNDCSDIIEGRV